MWQRLETSSKHRLKLVFCLTPCPPFRHQYHRCCHSLAALGFVMSALPIGRRCEHCVVRLAFSSTSLPCLMTLLLLYPALSRRSVRRGETLNFCNGLKWSKYHSPPCICYSFSPVITCCLISWCTDKGRGRFHGEGTLAVFVLLSTWHSVHFTAIILSHSTHSATETQGKDLSANCFQMEIKK